MLSIEHYLVLSLALFAIGVGGVLLRRNVIVMLMSIELESFWLSGAAVRR